MKEYEVVAKLYNACAGAARPQTFFEEVLLENTEDYVKMKHGKDFHLFSKEVLPTGQSLYQYDNGSVRYVYEFTAL